MRGNSIKEEVGGDNMTKWEQGTNKGNELQMKSQPQTYTERLWRRPVSHIHVSASI